MTDTRERSAMFPIGQRVRTDLGEEGVVIVPGTMGHVRVRWSDGLDSETDVWIIEPLPDEAVAPKIGGRRHAQTLVGLWSLQKAEAGGEYMSIECPDRHVATPGFWDEMVFLVCEVAGCQLRVTSATDRAKELVLGFAEDHGVSDLVRVFPK